MATSETPPRLLLIALDAFPPNLLDRWCADGSLPNLRRFREEGRSGTVTSDAALFPGAVWPTVFTGTDVSHHANYHLVQYDPETRKLRPPGPGWCEVTPFWQRLAAAGTPTIAIDVPFSDTGAAPANTTEIVGWGMHEGVWDVSRPRGLLSEMRKRHGRAEQLREGPGERSDEEIVRELPGLVRDVTRRVSIIEDLASRFPWRLLLAVFTETHRAGHWLWGEHGTGTPQGGVKAVAGAFDASLPRLRALLRPQDQMAIFAAHGMSASYDIDRLGEGALLYLSPPHARDLTRRLDPVYLLRQALPLPLVRTIARGLPQGLYNWTYYRLQNNHGDWSRLPWVVHPLDHTVYVHAAGDDAEEALQRLAAEFAAITTPDGEPVTGEIVRPRDRFRGPRLGLLPDLVVTARRRLYGPELVFNGVRRQAPRHSSRDGEHDATGFYIQNGPGIAPGAAGPVVEGQRLAAFLGGPAGLRWDA